MVLTIGQIFAGISGFVLTLCLVRIFNPAEYGFYAYILSIASMIAAFTLSGLDISVAQAVARGSERTLIKGFLLKLKWTIPVSLLTLLGGSYYLYKNNDVLGYSLLIIGLCSPLLYASSLYGSYFNGKKQFTKIANDNIYKNIAITTSVILVAYLTEDVIYAVLTLFLSNMIISSVRYFLLVRKIDKNAFVDNKSLSLGKHLSLMDSFSNFSTYIDKVIIFQLLGATSLAIYAIALAPIRQLHGTSKIIRSLILPKFSTRTYEELRDALPHKMFITFLISIVLILSYITFAEFLFIHFFPEYQEAVRYSQVLSLTLFTIPLTLYTQALTSLGSKKELYILNITKPVIRIIPLIILVPIYGIWGAVFSLLIFYIVHCFMLYILFKMYRPK